MRLSFLLAALVLAAPLSAQTVPQRGADDTFDVAAWNVEFFGQPGFGPSNDALQLNNVAAVMEQAGIDLWALQEVVDQTEWNELRERLDEAGYSGRLGPQVSNNADFDQRLAFIYDRSVVQVVGSGTILEDDSYDFAFRPPFEMQARVTLGGESQTIRVITFHAKAGTGSTDYNRRAAGSVALKAYVDDRVARGESVILLGDFNDYLLRSTRSGQPSPYANFVGDDSYVAATLPIEQAGVPTFCQNSSCTSGSTRDHLLFTANLDAEYVDGSGDRFSEVITGVGGYTNTTSDHVPVLARFSFRPTPAETGPEAGAVALLPAAPSPFRTDTRLRFRLGVPADVALDVFDVMGRRVAGVAGAYGVGEHAVVLDGSRLASGVYLVRLQANGEAQTSLITRLD